MAKSTYETLNTLAVETSVPEVKNDKDEVIRYNFGMVEHTLSRELFPNGETYIDKEKLVKWADEKGYTHSLLQLGLQQAIIKVRGVFKSLKKDVEWTPELGQENADSWKYPVQGKPKESESDVKEKAIFNANVKIAEAMKKTKGISEKMILDTLTESCGEEMAQKIVDSLN